MEEENKKEQQEEQESPTTSVETFNNDLIAVDVEREPGCLVKMTIKLTPKAAQAAYKKAVKQINKEVSLPGFRKGRAPDNLIIEHYGKYVDQEWNEILVRTSFQDAMTLTNTVPLNENTIQKPQMKKASKEEGAEIVIKFESSPDVPMIDSSLIKLQSVARKEVTEEEIEDSIENIRLHHAEWEEVTDRGVEEGDYIDLDIENLDKPGEFLCKDTRFEVAEGKMGEWMRKLVLGKKVEESVEGVSERTEEASPEKEFIETNCRLTVKSIKKAKLPEINDELGVKVGAENLDDMKQKLSQTLNKQKDQDVNDQLRKQVEEALLKEYPFDIPKSLLEREKKNRLESTLRQWEQAGMAKKEITSKIDSLEHSIKEDTDRAYRLFFLSRKFADENDLHVSNDELVRELMQQMYMPGSAMESSADVEEVKTRIYITLLSEKVKDFIIDKAEIQ